MTDTERLDGETMTIYRELVEEGKTFSARHVGRLLQEIDALSADRDAALRRAEAAEQWSVRWKAAATRHRSAHVRLLVALCEMQGAFNEADFGRQQAEALAAGATVLVGEIEEAVDMVTKGWLFKDMHDHEQGLNLLAEIFEKQPQDRVRELGAAVAGMADQIDWLLSGGILMKPTEDGAMTFEALVMCLQMLRLHADQYRAARAPAAGEGEGTNG